jgi:periplasmic protein CpxP/Spy
MKSSLKTLLAAAVVGMTVLPMAGLAEDQPAAPPADAPRGAGGGGQRGGRGMNPEQQVTRVEEAVGKLTDDQKTKITAIYTKQREQLRAMMENQSGPPDEATMAKMQEVGKAARAEVRALLTPEQQPKFDAMPQRGPGSRGGPGGGGERRREGGAAPKTE